MGEVLKCLPCPSEYDEQQKGLSSYASAFLGTSLWQGISCSLS